MRIAVFSAVGFAVLSSSALAAERLAELKVSSLKPGLTQRHVLTLRGSVLQKPQGDFQWQTEATVREAAAGQPKGSIRIKVVGTADAEVGLIRASPADLEVTRKIELTELAGKHGEFDVQVVDRADAVLFSTTVKL